MTKSDAVGLFGDVLALSRALGVTRQAIYQWDDDLPHIHSDRVTGAAVRLGLLKLRRSKSDDYRAMIVKRSE